MNTTLDSSQAVGSALRLNNDGHVTSVIADDLSIFSSHSGGHLDQVVDTGSREKLHKFLQRIRTRGSAMGWELRTITESRVRTLHYFGVRHSDHLFVVISHLPENILLLYEQMVDIVNEQGVMLRQCQQALNTPPDRQEDGDDLSSFMRLNNELINAQRELTIRNRMLNREKERTRQLFEFNPDALLVLSEDGEVITANSAANQLFGQDMNDLPNIRLKLPDNPEGCTELCIQCREGERVLECRSMNMDWDGQPVSLVSMRDVTDRKELEELKEDVDRIARHDLKSPLGGVVSLSTYLADTAEGEVAECARLIAQASSTVLDMVNDSLSLYHMECGTYALKRDSVAIKPILDQIILDNDILVQGKELCVDLKLDDQDMILNGEESLYRSMFSNIVKNAVEAAPDTSCVTIAGSVREHDSTISVHNDGAVPKPVRKSFFEKYATHGKKHGSGLGTYSARLVAQTLGGSLLMETSEQSGTTLTFSMPHS